ncbi:hypothetical protein ACI2LV_13200 [Streptomyces fungicidicus]|uniref:hypothetical protein n=1 Tax=Streptomyces fungicidicus TaxID=68203 RepID=UPI00384F39A3
MAAGCHSPAPESREYPAQHLARAPASLLRDSPQVLVHNCLIVDDPHKDRAEAESRKMREKVHDWWSSAALKRLQPDRNAVVAIQTRWHPDDFAGRWQEEDADSRTVAAGRSFISRRSPPSKFGPDRPPRRGPAAAPEDPHEEPAPAAPTSTRPAPAEVDSR